MKTLDRNTLLQGTGTVAGVLPAAQVLCTAVYHPLSFLELWTGGGMLTGALLLFSVLGRYRRHLLAAAAAGVAGSLLLFLLLPEFLPQPLQGLPESVAEGFRFLLGRTPSLSPEGAGVLKGLLFALVSLLGVLLPPRWRGGMGAAVLVYGGIRWHQYVPGLEGPCGALALGGLYDAVIRSGPAVRSKAGEGGLNPGALLLLGSVVCLGTFGVSRGLEALFPLEAFNRWVGSALPVSDLYRNGYSLPENGGSFRLRETFWQPLGDRLGGSVTLQRLPVMGVRSNLPGLRLRGNVGTLYTGESWGSAAVQEHFTEAAASGGETPYFLIIDPYGLQQQTLFTPLGVERVTLNEGVPKPGDEGLYLRSRSGFLQRSGPYAVEGYLKPETPGALGDRDRYLQLPELPDRVKQMAETVVQGASDDGEKVRRLETWLRSRYRYSLQVGDPVPGQDFVDQFLFVEQQGYCTYFASALAVLGRCVGVPTRYVEGYVLPEQVESRQTYQVTSDRAHAWVEAWIEGEGWVTLEPTPAYPLPGTAQAPLAENPAQEAVPSPEPGPEASEPITGETPSEPRAPVPAGWALAVGVLLAAARVLTVELCWRRKLRTAAHPDIWQLYAALSAFKLSAPDLARIDALPEQLRAALDIFHLCGDSDHDIIEDTNRLLYTRSHRSHGGYARLMGDAWTVCRRQLGLWRYLYHRYGTLALFNGVHPLV